MAKSKSESDDTSDDFRNEGAVVETKTPPAPPQPAPTTVAGPDDMLKGVKKGDLVRLLEPHYDGFKRMEAGSLVRWWNDDPPSARYVALPETPETPLEAPPMTDGKPPADYLDPETGKKPIITTV